MQKSCIDEAKSRGFIAVNVHGGGWSSKGFPDLLIFGNGRACAVELKSDTSGYTLQVDQKIWRERFKRAGIPHYVLNNLSDFKSVLETLK